MSAQYVVLTGCAEWSGRSVPVTSTVAVVCCDHDGCAAVHHNTHTARKDAWMGASDEGWHLDDAGRDYCPQHGAAR